MVVTYWANGSRFSSFTNTRFSLLSFSSFLTWKFQKNICFQNNSKYEWRFQHLNIFLFCNIKAKAELIYCQLIVLLFLYLNNYSRISGRIGPHSKHSRVSYLWGPWVPWGPLLHSCQAFRAHQVSQAVLDCHLYLEVLEVLGGPLYSSHGLVGSEPWGKPTWLHLDKRSQTRTFLILVWFWELA